MEAWKRMLEWARKEMELEELYDDWCDGNDRYDISFSEYKNRMSFDYSDIHSDHTVTNPVTGLSMMGGVGGIDIAGNMYGSNFQTDHSYQSHSSYNDYYKY